jgi:hypothetical protein
MTVIPIGRINDDPGDFHSLCQIWQKAMGAEDDIAFEFTWCDFLRPNALVFLGGLARLLQQRGRMVDFRWHTLQNSWVQMNLTQNGFRHQFGHHEGPWKGNSIPFREDAAQNERAFENYLSEYWLGRGWLNISPELKNRIVAPMAELYLNAFEHAASPVGVMACGQYFKNRNELTLAIADFGVGIPSNVRLYQGRDALMDTTSGAACMQWALKEGTSTKGQQGISRGAGLRTLLDFVCAAKGSLQIYSHDGGFRLVDNQESYATLGPQFEGTLVNIRLRCDPAHYDVAAGNVSVVAF